MTRSALHVSILAAAFGLATGNQAAAAAYPSKPIRLLVPYAPGGAVDATARALGAQLSSSLGQTVIVENKPGASGMIAVENLTRAAPDGYTILIDTSAIAMNPSVYSKALYRPESLRPVAQVMSMPFVIAANNGAGDGSLPKFMALLRERPGSLNAASSGTSSRLFAELFRLQTKTEFMSIIYSGAAPAIMAVMKNDCQLIAMDVANIAKFITSKQLSGLVVSGDKRSSALPDVPSAVEAGVPGFDVTTWFGIFAPADTPQPVVDRLNQSIREASRAPAVAELLKASAADPSSMTAAEFEVFFGKEVARWRTVVQEAKIQID